MQVSTDKGIEVSGEIALIVDGGGNASSSAIIRYSGEEGEDCP
jgi:hypothetical protein